MKLVKLSVFALTLGLFAASCGGGSGETPATDTVSTSTVVETTPEPVVETAPAVVDTTATATQATQTTTTTTTTTTTK